MWKLEGEHRVEGELFYFFEGWQHCSMRGTGGGSKGRGGPRVWWELRREYSRSFSLFLPLSEIRSKIISWEGEWRGQRWRTEDRGKGVFSSQPVGEDQSVTCEDCWACSSAWRGSGAWARAFLQHTGVLYQVSRREQAKAVWLEGEWGKHSWWRSPGNEEADANKHQCFGGWGGEGLGHDCVSRWYISTINTSERTLLWPRWNLNMHCRWQYCISVNFLLLITIYCGNTKNALVLRK